MDKSEAKQSASCPGGSQGKPVEYGSKVRRFLDDVNEAVTPGSLTYNAYLKVDELKSLQICQSDPAHHDEPLFIVIHQSYELWFKLLLHEIDGIIDFVQQGRVRKAVFYMRRVIAIWKLLVQQIHILETMAPKDFLGFRYNLSPASGFQSSQFREIEFVLGLKEPGLLEHFNHDEEAYAQLKKRYDEPSLLESFYALLRKQGFAMPEFKPAASEEENAKLEHARITELLKIYQQEENYGDLHDLAELMVELDELIFFWRAHHVTVVERMIGYKRGTGGSEGVGYLRSTLDKRCFTDLWRLRTYLQHDEMPDASPSGAGGCPFAHS